MRKATLMLISLLLLSPVFIRHAHAAGSTVIVPIETSLEPVTAVGLIFQPGRTLQKGEAKFEKGEKGIWKISFQAERSELGTDALISAMIIADNGDVAFADLAPAGIKGNALQYLSIPECSSPKASLSKLHNQSSVLESLVAVRSERRQVLKQSIADELQGELLEKAVRLERGFGLTTEEELSAELSPVKLTDRLSRLITAIKNHRANRAPAAEGTPAETQPPPNPQ